MDPGCYTINIYDNWGYYHDLDYKDHNLEEDWGHFVDIEIDTNIKRNTKYLHNKKSSYISADEYKLKKKPKNNSIVTNILIKISSTTFITIGVTYLIFYAL